jgi:hypothetical protein
MFVSSDRLQLAVERLGKSCATQRLVDFLILKRAMVLKKGNSVALSKNDPFLVDAIKDMMEVRPGAAEDSSEEFPYINVFGTESHNSKGYRSRKYTSNGTAVTVAGWHDLIKISGEKPRFASFKTNVTRGLPSLMLKAHGEMPLKSDLAVWFYRQTSFSESVESPGDLADYLKNDLGLTDEEASVLFVVQDESFDGWCSETVADSKTYLPFKTLQSGVEINPEEEERSEAPKVDEDGLEIESKSGKEAFIDQPYDPTRTNITTRQITIDLLLRRIKEGEIDLNTAFQRRGDLWSETQKSRLIESLMIKIPLPSFYFDATNDSRWLVVDGLQRLTTLDLFLHKSMPLQNLEFLSEFNAHKYGELPRPLRRRIEETQVTVNLIQSGTPDRVKFYIFRRINTGGLVLNAQEIRHALNQGRAVDFLRELARSDEFKKATDGSVSDKRMADCEFVLRFVAFTLVPYTKYVVPDLDAFLNEQMSRLNKELVDFDSLRDSFKKAMTVSIELFGNDAFRKHEGYSGKRNPINRALFEAWAVTLGKLNKEQVAALIRNQPDVKSAEADIYRTDYEFVQSVTQGTGDAGKVGKRFSTIEKLVARFVPSGVKSK